MYCDCGPVVTPGYFNESDLNAQLMEPDGWLASHGRCGRFDERVSLIWFDSNALVNFFQDTCLKISQEKIEQI